MRRDCIINVHTSLFGDELHTYLHGLIFAWLDKQIDKAYENKSSYGIFFIVKEFKMAYIARCHISHWSENRNHLIYKVH